MINSTRTTKPIWKRDDSLRLFLTAMSTLVVLYQFVISLTKPRGDFLLHREFGRRLLAGEFLYQNGMHIPYPPFWAVPNAPLSLLPTGVAKSLFLLIGVSALVSIIRMLNVLSENSMPLGKDRLRMAVIGSLVFTSPFLLRDLDDGGQNLALLALSLGGIYFWTRDRTVPAGAALGAAVALKCTPVLLLLYFAWKREWKMASVTLAFALAFSLSPILWQGPASYTRHMRAWSTQVTHSLSARDPSIGILGPEKLQNRALRPALARYLMFLPPRHPGRFEGRGYIDIGRLSPPAAGRVIEIFTLLLLAAIAWLFRSPARPAQSRSLEQRRPAQQPLFVQQEMQRPEDATRVLWEVSTLFLLMLLCSPITWGQHCVAALPITYLLIRSRLSGCKMPRWRVVSLAAIVGLILGTDRLILGRHLALLLESYHLVTLALLALLIISLVHGHCRGADFRMQTAQAEGEDICLLPE